MAYIKELKATVIIWLIIYAIKTGRVSCECENLKNVFGTFTSFAPIPKTVCDVKIKTSSVSDHCQPTNGPYCFSLKNEGELQETNGCPLGGPKVECQTVSCNTETKMLKDFSEHLEFLRCGQTTQPNEKAYDSCGPVVVNNFIEFCHNSKTNRQMNCTHTFLPSTSLNASGSTLTFSVDLIDPETQFENS